MILVLGYILAFFIGITLGLVGSGGSILTIPILVYILGIDPNLATTYSLFAIAVSSSIGSVRNFYLKQIDLSKLIDFGLPSIVMVFVTRQFLLPLVPEVLAIGPWLVHQNIVLMLLLGVIMLLSAWRMINSENLIDYQGKTDTPKYIIALQGALLGVITGAVGAGGGFLIIPALINFYRMPMKRAVCTSLAIIALNSLFGLAGDLEKIPLFDWELIGSYTLLLIVGMFLGFYVSKYFQSQQLKRGLGYLVLVLGVYILIKEVMDFVGPESIR